MISGRSDLKSSQTIFLLVLVQVAVISASFGLLISIEHEEKNSADHVNIAGKNRMYTVLVLHEFEKFMSGEKPDSDVIQLLDEYDENILLLKNGGIFLEHDVVPIPDEFILELQRIEIRFFEFKDAILNFIEYKNSNQNPPESYFEPFEIAESELFSASNSLTEKLTIHFNKKITLLQTLDIVLPIINGIVYIITVYLILKILRRENKTIQQLEKFNTIGQMASRLAHDLKNPLTVIQSSLDMLDVKSTDKNDFTEKMHGRIKDSVKEISHITNDVLEFTRTQKLNISKFSILEILKDSVSGINIPNTVTFELPKNDAEIKCDYTKLKSVFVNLFSNALDAIKGEGKISVKLEITMNYYEISVSDSGPEIPENILAHIFDPLYTSKSTGTGLGLTICKNIVEQHKGKISVSSNPTTFTIKLPKN